MDLEGVSGLDLEGVSGLDLEGVCTFDPGLEGVSSTTTQLIERARLSRPQIDAVYATRAIDPKGISDENLGSLKPRVVSSFSMSNEFSGSVPSRTHTRVGNHQNVTSLSPLK